MMRAYTDLERTGDLITADETEALLIALAKGQGNFSEDEAVRLVKWAHLQRTGATVLDMLIQGRATISLREGDEPVIGRGDDRVRR